MQPNDDRGENPLDPDLDSHIIATSGYQNFPAFTTGGVFDDTIANAVMPNIVGMTQQQATTALTNAGLTGGASGNNVTQGATSQNNGKVASQSPAAGTAVNADVEVTWTIYNYVNPGTTVTLTSGSVVGQNTGGGMQPLKGRASLSNVVGGEEGSALYLAAASNGLVGKTITFSGNVSGTAGADGGELSYFAGQTFTITASSSSHQNAVPGMFPATDYVRVEWTASGPNYGFSQFTAGTATISA